MLKKKSILRPMSVIAHQKIDIQQETYIPPSDMLVLKILSLRLPDQGSTHFAIKATLFDQLLVHAIIKSIGARDKEPMYSIANGTLTYDPSDYEKMCLFADYPLVVHIQPLRGQDSKTEQCTLEQSNLTEVGPTTNISCCNIDILPIFLGVEDQQKMCIKKRMEPMVEPSMKHRKSWDNLPLLTLELTAERNPQNVEHHKLLKESNWMQVTLIAIYNMYIPFENANVYTAASKTPLHGDSKLGLVTFSQGYKEPRRFNCTNFYPKWESLRSMGDLFTNGDQILKCKLEDIQNEDGIDLPYYLNRILPYHTSVWGSFHRTLLMDTDQWFWSQLRDYKWPLEFHIYGETGGYSFMAFLNLFQLLYPGEHTLRLAVPLRWIDSASMMYECGCELLLTPNDKAPSVHIDKSPSTVAKNSKVATDSFVGTSMSTLTTDHWKPTGADDNDAFVLVEVKLGRPLQSVVRLPRIFKDEISAMLVEMESKVPRKRACSGRGQLEREWQQTVREAAHSLRKVPYYGATEFCAFNRQLSETRTQVELTTTCGHAAAIFMNNNFVIQQYLHSDEIFEELVMMSHACLMKSASAVLMSTDTSHEVAPELRAARHARQMQDTYHAMELYLQLIVDNPHNPDYWRELSTCLKDLDRDWANVCLNKAVVLEPRHPLNLLSKGAMLFEENPMAAEPFFTALFAIYPKWTTLLTIISVYFYERELFYIADIIMTYAEKNITGKIFLSKGRRRNKRYSMDHSYPRTWEKELGDWWDSTPLLPGMSLYYDAADLLLRLRAVPLAEACVARILSTTVETAPYYHLLGLCCRLRGEYKDALCHLTIALEKFGEINYLRSLEAECHHRLGNVNSAITSFGKAGSCVASFSILMSLACGDNERARTVLIDLVRRQASAYAWTALADDWIKVGVGVGERDAYEASNKNQQKAAKFCAIACVVQALKVDRRAGKAWAMLGKYVKPKARRLHCIQMANICGWNVTNGDIELAALPSKHSLCHGVGSALRECRCNMCDKTRV